MTLAAGETVNTAAGPAVNFQATSGGTFINQGTVIVSSSDGVPGVITAASGADPTAVFENNGTFTLTADRVAGTEFGAGGAVIEAVTFQNNGVFSATISDSQFSFDDWTISASIPTATGATRDVVNAGSFSVQGVGQAVGVFDGRLSGLVQNQLGATMTISASAGPAIGVEFIQGGEFDNAGDLFVAGQAQNLGGWTDTLSNFQALTGSAFADLLEGGGSASTTLAGGLGADTFLYRSGDGNMAVADFSHPRGDRIDLSNVFGSWSDIHAALSQSGANAVIALPGGGSLTLDGVDAGSLTAADFLLPQAPVGDFLGTGHSGLFWQNAVNNLTSVWTVDDSGATHGVSLPAVPGWQTLDVGNFSGGPYGGDFLLRNTSTGMVDVWTDNAGVMSGQDVDQATLDWNIMGTADFNGDGKSDILWRNEQNGYVSVWQMDGAHVTTTYNPGQVGLEWKIVGAGDYVGDGKAEVLWRNTATGEVNLWTIDGPGAGQTHGQTIADLPPEWQVAGSGNFNGDGRSDILWQDQVNGQMVIWEMSGAQVLANQAIGDPGPQWKVVSVADLNGDGHADILWRDSGTGQVVTWEMNGFAVDHFSVLATVDNTWQTINHHYDWA